MQLMWRSAWPKTRRWCKRRCLRWVALMYWSYCWLLSSGSDKQAAHAQFLRVLSGFNYAGWVLLMQDFIRPEYWPN